MLRAAMMAKQITFQKLKLADLKKGASRSAMLIAVLTVAGCSTPDWADPTEWFEDDENRPQQIEGQKGEAAENGEYPKLGTVPAQAGNTISIQEAENIEQGLNADRTNAEYTDEKLRADTAVQSTPAPKPIAPPAPAASAASTGPAVTAAPKPAVSSNQLGAPTKPVQVVNQPTSGNFPQTQQVQGAKLIPNAAPITTPQQAYARQVPGSGTVVISGAGVQDVFQKQLAASAATTTTLTASNQFQSYPVQPIGNSAVSVSPIVRDVYNQPVALGYGAAANNGAIGSPVGASSYAGLKPAAVIHFEVGSSRVGAGDRNKLAQIAQMQKQTGAFVKVVGHASSRTRQLPLDRHKLVNLRMSQDRSSSVVKGLIAMGVPTQAIQVEASSDSQPVTRESMPSEEAKNRRTEIFLVK
jgi:outer membrane protein OmpA-like peptidoglycan-associated protein